MTTHEKHRKPAMKHSHSTGLPSTKGKKGTKAGYGLSHAKMKHLGKHR